MKGKYGARAERRREYRAQAEAEHQASLRQRLAEAEARHEEAMAAIADRIPALIQAEDIQQDVAARTAEVRAAKAANKARWAALRRFSTVFAIEFQEVWRRPEAATAKISTDLLLAVRQVLDDAGLSPDGRGRDDPRRIMRHHNGGSEAERYIALLGQNGYVSYEEMLGDPDREGYDAEEYAAWNARRAAERAGDRAPLPGEVGRDDG